MPTAKTNINERIEKIISLTYEISQRILKEYSADPEQLGISGFTRLEPFINKSIITEEETFQENRTLFGQVFNYFKHSADQFRAMEKQECRDSMICEEIEELIKYMMKLRYSIGGFFEYYNFHEKMIIRNIEQKRREESVETTRSRLMKVQSMLKDMPKKPSDDEDLIIDKDTHLFIQEYLKKFLKEKNNSTLSELIKARVMYIHEKQKQGRN